ncbi:MAG: ABC transporter substrate-binding protein, partial [Burkholderiaceae bacterium]
AQATAGRTIKSPFGIDGTLTMRAEDNTLTGYTVGYSKTLDKDPWITDFQSTSWKDILMHEADWKKRKGYT